MKKTITGFEGLYEIDDCGRVFSIGRNRYLKPWTNAKGYSEVYLLKNKKRYTKVVQRIMGREFLDNNRNMCVHHLNNNKTDNRLSNLVLMERSKHSSLHASNGNQVGEKNNFSKYTESDIREIRKMYKNGVRVVDICKEFGIHRRYVYRIINREFWKHI